MTVCVSVVIPTWNGLPVLREALHSLARQTWQGAEIIVVDNGSTDGTVAALARDFPSVRVVPLPDNRGFGAATNAGIAAAQGDVLVCMNNDVVAAPDWLAALVGALDAHPACGSVASRMLVAAEPSLIDAAGDTMSLVAWNIGHGEADGPRFARGREVLSACAGAAAYRRSLFEAVGPFDEAYFTYFEDMDLGIRAQLAGFRCWYEPTAVVRHHGSATAVAASEFKAFYTTRNALMLFFKTMPLRRLVPWAPLMLAWPWINPFLQRRRLAPHARAWFAFLGMLAGVWRRRRAMFAGRHAEVPRLLALLDSPLDDIRRALGRPPPARVAA